MPRGLDSLLTRCNDLRVRALRHTGSEGPRQSLGFLPERLSRAYRERWGVMEATGCDSVGIVAVWLVIAGAFCAAFPDVVVMLRGGASRDLFGRNDRRTNRFIGIGNVVL